MADTATERTLQNRVDAREIVHGKMSQLLEELDGKTPDATQNETLAKYRSDLAYYDGEIAVWSDQVTSDRNAAAASEAMRRATLAARGVADMGPDGEVIYRSLGQIAIDQLLTHKSIHARGAVSAAGVPTSEIQKAEQRLEAFERAPASTLTSDIAGLSPPQHLAQIFQVLNSSRPLVEAAGTRTTLTQLTVTYPQLDATPVVAAQGTQKTEAGNTGMDVSMVTKTATTYLGGGNLSWQAIEFSTPSAFDLWFRAIAADYALKTETDAATVVSASAFLNNVSSPIATSADFATFLAAVGAGYGEVFANSGRIANAIIMAPDRFGYLLGMTSAAFSQFIDVGQGAIGPLRVVVSRGLNAGEIIVGDLDGLLVAENAGAPVRMFVSEPAIAGVEVGLVGAFEAAVVDDGAFSLISTAS
jgi:hypothetical protein